MDGIHAFDGSTINVTGRRIGGVRFWDGSKVNFSGGGTGEWARRSNRSLDMDRGSGVGGQDSGRTLCSFPWYAFASHNSDIFERSTTVEVERHDRIPSP